MKTSLHTEFSGSESDGSEEEKDNSSSVPHKRRRFSDDERRTRCRERNKIHARNTRERKRVQMETLQQNIQDLIDEKVRLTNMLPDSSIASILMSLNQIGEGAGLSDVGASSGIGEESGVSLSEAMLQQENEISKEVRRRANLTIEKLRLQVSALLNVDEELDINQICNGNSSFTDKDRSKFTKAELGQIRRERNRLHAKKTRLKKKKMLAEMELIISGLQDEISILKGETANISNSASSSHFMPGLPSAFAAAQPPKLSLAPPSMSSSAPSSEGMLDRPPSMNFSRSNSSLLQYFNPQLAVNGANGSGGAQYSGQQSYFGADSSLFGPFVDVARTVAAMSAYSDRQMNMDAMTATTTSSSSNPSTSPGGYQNQLFSHSYPLASHSHSRPSHDRAEQSRSGSDATDGSEKSKGLHIDTHQRSFKASSMDEYENSPLALILAASSIREGSFDRTSKSESGSTDSNNERDSDQGNCSGAEDMRGDRDQFRLAVSADAGRSPKEASHCSTNSFSSHTNTSSSSSSEGKEDSTDYIIAMSVGRPDPF